MFVHIGILSTCTRSQGQLRSQNIDVTIQSSGLHHLRRRQDLQPLVVLLADDFKSEVVAADHPNLFLGGAMKAGAQSRQERNEARSPDM